MKTLSFISILFLFVLYSCNSGTNTNRPKVTFGIHEVVKISEIPNAILDTLKSKNVQIENNPQQSIIGYITKADSLVLQPDLSKGNYKFVKTIYPVDKDQRYYAIAAIRPGSVIDNSHIKKTKANVNNVEIYFNMEGANRWAELTKKNIGNTVALIIDNQIYSMPVVNGEIRNGIALINSLENEDDAKIISESLNLSIPE